jgi:hypothetical protein
MEKFKNNQLNTFTMKRKLNILATTLFVLILSTTETTYAIPTYARQTGLACAACHTVYPQLTAFGRYFKLNGYTLTNIKTVSDKYTNLKKEVNTTLNLLGYAPISAMFQTGLTSLSKAIPGTQNNNVEFPQQLSLFYGGQITPKMGSFIQITLDNGSGTFGLDNTDIRYSNTTTGKVPITYGFTLNNNPTVQDLWNTVPAWSFPYTSSGVAPGPGASAAIQNLGGSVAGLGFYAMINNAFYVEFAGYRTAQLGAALPPDASVEGALNGTAPYWRAAIQHQWTTSYLEVGTYGMSSKLFPVGVSGLTDNFRDFGIDAQYEYQFQKGQFTLHTNYLNENQILNSTFDGAGSENLNNHLNQFNLDGSVFLKPGVNFTLGYFNMKGSSDNGLYAPNEVDGSNAGVPDSSGFRTQFDVLPWENTKFSIQYFAYSKFNGASTNYDGFSRNASDNNMIYLQLWFAF